MPEPAALIRVTASVPVGNGGSHPSRASTSGLLLEVPGLSAGRQGWLLIKGSCER